MRIKLISLIAIVAGMSSLSGCVVAPAHGYGYGSRVYVSPPPIIIESGPRWGGGRHWRRW